MARTYDLWINGRWTKASTGALIDRTSPAHGELLARFAEGSRQDVDHAVEVARRTFDRRAWSDLPGNAKALLLSAWADLIGAKAEELAKIEAEESGKPIRFARSEVAWSIDLVRYAAALAWQLKGDVFTNLGADALGLVTREPRGVVGMIVPWNFPIITLMQKLPFALAAGCTAVIKPSEMTSGTALEVAALAKVAGIPDGVINVVTGLGETVGEAISGHPEIDMISFTGSTAVGKGIARNQAARIGRIGLELGGKGANIVFADADIEAALDGVLFGIILNQGEECCAGSRLLVEKSLAQTFTARLVARAKKVRIGVPLDETADMSALISEKQMNAVLARIALGKEEGGRPIVGGGRLTDGGRDRGFFVEPTIFDNITPQMTLFREEVFGPVLTVTTFGCEEEAIALTNDTLYGLANGFWTKDIDKVHRVSRRLRSGTLYVNTYLETAMQLPFGGYKQSGVGREMGLDGLLEFTEIKSTFIKLGERKPALPHAVD
jgi:betaine-aldehyde dehydrogenase